jgi:hypothetical protein
MLTNINVLLYYFNLAIRSYGYTPTDKEMSELEQSLFELGFALVNNGTGYEAQFILTEPAHYPMLILDDPTKPEVEGDLTEDPNGEV